jgi:hypothetical protein
MGDWRKERRQLTSEPSHEPRRVPEPITDQASDKGDDHKEGDGDGEYAGMSPERRALEEQRDDVGIGGGITLLGIGTGGAATGAFFGFVFLDDGYDGFAHMAFVLGGVGGLTMVAGTLILISAINRHTKIQKTIDTLERSESGAQEVRPGFVVGPGFVGAGLSGRF